MDGKRIQEYLSKEAKALLTVYRQFQTLLPADNEDAASHKGEDGRYIESLISEYLKRYLPKDLEVLTGFILRPAVKTGTNNRMRKGDEDTHSTQLDIIVYDSCHYPIFQRFGNNVIVPPEGVIAILSVKKQFGQYDFQQEAIALKKAAKLCRYTTESKIQVRGPYLGMVAMHSIGKKKTPMPQWVFEQIKSVYSADKNDTFDETVGVMRTPLKKCSLTADDGASPPLEWCTASAEMVHGGRGRGAPGRHAGDYSGMPLRLRMDSPSIWMV